MKIYLVSENDSFSYEIEKEKITIGRSTQNDFCVPHDELSRNHCELYLQNEQLSILDLGSKNGIYIDGARIPPFTKVPFSIESAITLSKKFKLSMSRKPGHTILGLTGQIMMDEPSPAEKASALKVRRKK